MRRRDFVTVLGGAAAWPVAARAQRAGTPFRIGLVPIGSPSNPYDRSLVEAFREGLLENGLVENRDLVLDLTRPRT
jgi:putative ABC transport system substrate-binding protein